jgi:hypothetical protein
MVPSLKKYISFIDDQTVQTLVANLSAQTDCSSLQSAAKYHDSLASKFILAACICQADQNLSFILATASNGQAVLGLVLVSLSVHLIVLLRRLCNYVFFLTSLSITNEDLIKTCFLHPIGKQDSPIIWINKIAYKNARGLL